MSSELTKTLLEDFVLCRTKFYFQFHKNLGGLVAQPTPLAGCAEASFDLSNPNALDARALDRDKHVLSAIAESDASSAKHVSLVAANAQWYLDAITRQAGRSALGNFHWLPIVFSDSYRVEPQTRVLLNLYAEVLNEHQRVRPRTGLVYLPSNPRPRKLKLESTQFKYRKVRNDLLAAIETTELPALALNRHCDVCAFAADCKQAAVKADHLSLLRFVPSQTQKTLSKRGITRVSQFAMTYRARKKINCSSKQVRQHALQARAILEKQTFILGAPAIPNSDAVAYLDVEGDPDRGMHYLIGVTIVSPVGRTHHSFWADDGDGRISIVDQLLRVLTDAHVTVVFSYGSYELKFLQAVKSSSISPQAVDKLLAQLVNVLSIIHDHFYFPTYSNGLKEIASKFGFQWSDPKAGGLQSIGWRRMWEQTRDDQWKQRLLTYNREDCEALELVVSLLRTAVSPEGTQQGFVNANHDSQHSFRGRATWRHPAYATVEFAEINKRAAFDYQRDRIYLKKRRNTAVQHKYPNRAKILKLKPDAVVERELERCPICGSSELINTENKPRRRAYYDLRFSGRSISRKVLHLKCSQKRCARCQHTAVSESFDRVREYGHALQSWMTYLNLAHNMSLKSVAETVSTGFGLPITYSTVYSCRKEVAYRYKPTYQQLLERICSGRIVHCDETEVHLRGGVRAYVWVLASELEVAYVFRPSRESHFLHDLLRDFSGVFISDFYAAYDGLQCKQQRCLIHLIRDINNDILANPWNSELKSVGTRFGELLRDIVGCIDENGLRRSKLRSYRKQIKSFFGSIEKVSYDTEPAEKLRERLLKNRDCLFTFIEFDGVPWNNNNAERAIKYFANYRARSDHNGTESSLNDYLVLLSIYVTCRYRDANFLRFLLSDNTSLASIGPKLKFRRSKELFDLHPVGWVSRRATLKRKARMTKKALPMLDRPTLIKRIEAGEACEYLCFYGHAVHSPVSKTCFSQWYPAPFEIDGVLYPTAAHWMMAAKARLFGDDEALDRIILAPDPKSAKAIGREVRGFDDKVWKANCRQIVTEGNVHKFSQNEELKAFLLSTGDAVLVEAAPRDQIWGIGLGQDNPKARDPKQWRGQNLLGFALMDVREKIRESV